MLAARAFEEAASDRQRIHQCHNCRSALAPDVPNRAERALRMRADDATRSQCAARQPTSNASRDLPACGPTPPISEEP